MLGKMYQFYHQKTEAQEEEKDADRAWQPCNVQRDSPSP